MNDATLNSIHSGFQRANDTLMSAQKFPVVGIFASVAQFFVSMAELVTAAAIAPIGRNKDNSNDSSVENSRNTAFNAHKLELATEGLQGLVTSVINVATVGFFVPIKRHVFPESVYDRIAQQVTKESGIGMKSLFGTMAPLQQNQVSLAHEFIRKGEQDKLEELLSNTKISLNQMIAIALPYITQAQVDGVSLDDFSLCQTRAFQLLAAFRNRDQIDDDTWNCFRGILYKHAK